MTISHLKFQTPNNAPFNLKLYFSSTNQDDEKKMLPTAANLEELLNHPMSGFQFLDNLDVCLEKCRQVYQKFSNRKHFIHVGMGGSVLSAEVLLQTLASTNSKVIFLNNLDADDIAEKLSRINLTDAVIYLVSKSGNTLETHLLMQILLTQLKIHSDLKHKTEQDLLKEFFIFATDPTEGPMRKMANEFSITCLEIPKNLGGRFCAFSAVTFLPALFAEIELEQFYQGAKDVKDFFQTQNTSSFTSQLANHLAQEFFTGKTQTVLMPYSSKLTSFTHWFAQLWAESLGKNNKLNETVGLTPIVAHGPADQHSLLQIFMQGPKDKTYFFIKINKTFKNFKSFKAELNQKDLTQIVHAQLEGTMAALQKENASMFLLEIKQLNAHSLGMLMYFFEYLTIVTGAALSINPYDQPGVESGKNLTWSILRDGKSPLLN